MTPIVSTAQDKLVLVDSAPEKKTLTISEFCRFYGIGKTRAYQEIKAGRLRIAKVGRRTLIPTISAYLWLQQCTEQGQ